MAGEQHPYSVGSATNPMTRESVERRMRGNTHVRCGERAGETDREQSRNRAPARLSIIGKGNKSQIATLVERTTRFVMLVRIPYDRNADRVANLLAKKMETLPEFMRNSVTWDQGKEMARHTDFTIRTGMPVYFCDPHSPWQRGSNENTNGLLRQYFPKGTDLSLHTQDELDSVAAELNGRPRQTLNWRKPIEVFNDLMANSVSP
jgi:transposase, IS30 family